MQYKVFCLFKKNEYSIIFQVLSCFLVCLEDM